MVVELLQNVAVLVALAVGLQMLARQRTRRSAAYKFAAGAVYGSAGIVGMMTPLAFSPGVIYDGRSIVLTLAGMFGGPVAAGVAAVMCGIYRLLLGGPGALPGTLVILEAALLGVLLHHLRRKDERWLGTARLWVFGLVVHVFMLALQLLLPEGRGWQVIQRIGPAVLAFYPLGFVLVAKVFLQAERTSAAEASLRENEERFRALVEGAPDAIFVQREGRFVYLNATALEQFGADSAEQLLGTEVLDRILPANREAISRRFDELDRFRRKLMPLEEILLRLDGSEVTVELSALPVVFESRDGAIVFARDITGRKDLEQRLFQAQKMEAVGRLAGGVAHDFNNMLQTILGYTDIILADTGPGHEHHESLVQVRKAAARSADLTRQLLGFARRQIIKPELLDLNACVQDLLKMLERMIGEDIDLHWEPSRGPSPVLLDPSQVAQILANLVVNARDAIPGVGCITIETSHVEFDDEYCRDHLGAQPGRYEMLAVSDNGSGMDRETMAQAFEPFFTTKGRDKGTGLGLATVFGIVKQNEGFINLYSEPGQGTTVRIYLRRAEGCGETAPPQPVAVQLPTGAETILLVEDEPALLELSRQILEKLGYNVVATNDPAEALAMVRDRGVQVDLLLTDVIMPRISGRDLCADLDREVPGLRCLYMSGYTDNVIVHLGVLEEGVHFLQKPFSSRDLAVKLREVFADRAAPTS